MTQSDCEERLMRRGNLIHPLRHCEERPMRRGNLIHPIRHCEERSDVAISSTPLRHCEERSDVAISSFKIFLKNKKVRSSRPQKASVQDDTFGVR